MIRTPGCRSSAGLRLRHHWHCQIVRSTTTICLSFWVSLERILSQQWTTVEESRIRRIPKLKAGANYRAWSTIIRSVMYSGPSCHGRSRVAWSLFLRSMTRIFDERLRVTENHVILVHLRHWAGYKQLTAVIPQSTGPTGPATVDTLSINLSKRVRKTDITAPAKDVVVLLDKLLCAAPPSRQPGQHPLYVCQHGHLLFSTYGPSEENQRKGNIHRREWTWKKV